MLKVFLFDLDDTLYPSSCGLWSILVMRMEQYMVDRLGIAPHTVSEMRRRYLATFGSTLNGLRHEFELDALEYLAYVHDVPLEQFIRPQPELAAMLRRLPLHKAIFTNADAPHARRVLAALGIAEHFPLIVDIHSMEFFNKPDPQAYRQVLALAGAKPDECIFVDDRVANLAPARALGMTTILVRETQGALPPEANYQIPNILEIEPIVAGALEASRP